MKKIQRYDCEEYESAGACDHRMTANPQGDYVEFYDYDEAVSDLQLRVDELEKAVKEAWETLGGLI